MKIKSIFVNKKANLSEIELLRKDNIRLKEEYDKLLDKTLQSRNVSSDGTYTIDIKEQEENLFKYIKTEHKEESLTLIYERNNILILEDGNNNAIAIDISQKDGLAAVYLQQLKQQILNELPFKLISDNDFIIVKLFYGKEKYIIHLKLKVNNKYEIIISYNNIIDIGHKIKISSDNTVLDQQNLEKVTNTFKEDCLSIFCEHNYLGEFLSFIESNNIINNIIIYHNFGVDFRMDNLPIITTVLVGSELLNIANKTSLIINPTKTQFENLRKKQNIKFIFTDTTFREKSKIYFGANQIYLVEEEISMNWKKSIGN